jgi:hypothetical protein
MSGALPPLSQYAFMAWCSVKAQGQFLSLPVLEVHITRAMNLILLHMTLNTKLGVPRRSNLNQKQFEHGETQTADHVII